MSGKRKVASGLGLSAAGIIWMYGTFAQQKQVEKLEQQVHMMGVRLENKLDKVIENHNADHVQLVVLDAIRSNGQTAERKRSE